MCSLEFPDLESGIHQLYSDEDLLVVGLAAEFGFGETQEVVEAFVDQTGVTFPVVFADGSVLNDVDWPDSLSPYPRQLVLDRDHRIVYVASEHHQSDLERAIDDAVAE